jgi:hypothetical protein
MLARLIHGALQFGGIYHLQILRSGQRANDAGPRSHVVVDWSVYPWDSQVSAFSVNFIFDTSYP